MPSPSYIKRRSSGYYLRIAVPAALQQRIGLTEIVRSLGTFSPRHAHRIAAEAAGRVLTVFDALLREPMSDHDPERIRALLEHHIREAVDAHALQRFQRTPRTRAEAEASLNAIDFLLDDYETAWLEQDMSAVSGHTAEFLKAHGLTAPKGSPEHRVVSVEMLRAEILALAIMKATEQGDFRREQDLRTAAFGVSQVPKSTGPTKLFSVAYVEYLNDRMADGEIGPETRIGDEAVLRLFLWAIGDKSIHQYTAEDMAKFKDTLRRLPAGASRLPGFASMTLEDVLSAPGGKAPATATTNKKRITRLQAFWTWAIKKTYADANIVKTIAIAKAESESPEGFTADELAKLFLSKDYLTGSFAKPWRYWIPLLGAYTGARINELAQLEVRDVVQRDGVWVLDINDLAEAAAPRKKLKNDSSARIVPLHSVLLDKGFLEFVETVRAAGHARLFHEIRPGKRGPGAYVSIEFRRYRERCGISGKKTKVFHSFRHGFVETLVQRDASREVVSALVGHSQTSITMRVYAKGFTTGQLKEAIERLEYPFEVGRVPAFRCL